jgi:hypothetical protein
MATAHIFGWRVGWWASLLCTVAPWEVYYGRLIWQASFVPVFAAGLYACTLLYFATEPRPRYLILGSLCWAATIQTHVTALLLLPAFLLIGWRFRKSLRARPLLMGAGLGALSFTPYLVYQVTSRFADWQALRTGIQGQLDTNLTALELALDLFRSRTIYETLGRSAELWRSQDLHWLKADALVVLWLGGAALVALATTVIHWKRFDARTTGWFISLVWLGVPIPFFIPHTRWVINHYFLYLAPVAPVLMALLSDTMFFQAWRWSDQAWRPWRRYASRMIAYVAFVPLALIAFQQARLDVIGQDLLAAGTSGHERVVDVQRAIDTARQLMGARPECQFVVMAEGPLWEDSRFGLMREFVGRDRVRFAEAGSAYLLPAPCAVYLSVTARPEAQMWLDQVARPLPEHTIQTPEETWLFYDLPTSSREAALRRLETRARLSSWTNDLRLTAFALQRQPADSGHPLTLTYTWAIGEAVPVDLQSQPHALRFGNYLLSENGVLVSQVDGVGVDSREWRAGDVFQTQWHLPVPPDLPSGMYSIATAVYSLPDIQRVRLTNGSDLLYLGLLEKPPP